MQNEFSIEITENHNNPDHNYGACPLCFFVKPLETITFNEIVELNDDINGEME